LISIAFDGLQGLGEGEEEDKEEKKKNYKAIIGLLFDQIANNRTSLNKKVVQCEITRILLAVKEGAPLSIRQFFTD